jgi:hypothetical protein
LTSLPESENIFWHVPRQAQMAHMLCDSVSMILFYTIEGLKKKGDADGSINVVM